MTDTRTTIDLAALHGARHDRTASASSVRSALVTVFGEFVLPSGGGAWTQSLLEVLRSHGYEDGAVRQALSRLGDRGWVVRERVGRRTRWRLTPWATELLDSGAERIYSFGQPRDWDARWLLLMASVPEDRRDLRYRLGVGLGWAGFGPIAPGTWVCPWSEREPEAVRLVDELGIDEVTVFRAEVGAVGDGRDLASRGWDLPGIDAAYRAFLETTALDPADDAEAAASLISLVHSWRRFPLIDPDLPRELLPDDWPGHQASTRFTTARADWQPGALRRWTELEDRYSSTGSRPTAG